MKNGFFVISLDYELYWGVHDVFSVEKYGENIRRVKDIIPRLLELFNKYQIHATFAVVGAIYHNSTDEFYSNITDTSKLPKYANELLSPYSGDGKYKVCKYPDLFFQNRIIELIRTQNHEICTHTYCHFYCDEIGASVESFEYDITKAVEIAEKYGDKISSIIFPRNQVNSLPFEKILLNKGITCYRCNPYKSFSNNNIHNKIIRTLSAYLPIFSLSSQLPKDEKIIRIKANHFLRPYTKFAIINRLQIYKIKLSIKQAAKKKQLFHLWWHPHNFGSNTEKNFEILEEILYYYKQMNKKYGIISAR